MISKIQSYLSLEKGWNGYDADPPNEHAVHIAKDIYYLSNIKPDRAVPTAMGGIALQWKSGNGIFLEVYNDGGICYVLNYDKKLDDMDIRSDNDANKVCQIINEYLNDTIRKH